MQLTFKEDEDWPGNYTIMHGATYRGIITMVDGAWCLDTNGEDLAIYELKQIVRFMETL